MASIRSTKKEPVALEVSKEVLMKDVVPKRIESVHFGLAAPELTERMSVMEVRAPGLYEMPQREPKWDGVLDSRLGTSERKGYCSTCNNSFTKCAGHFGYIRLALPVFHIGYFKDILHVLQVRCDTCACHLV